MMFIHHLWGYPENIIVESPALPEAFFLWANIPSMFCVAIFCFISGYSYYFSAHQDLRGSWTRIRKLLVPFLTVFVILLLISVVFLGYRYTFPEVLWDLITDRTVSTAWYVRFYILLMLTAPLYARFHLKKTVPDLFVTCILIPLILLKASTYLPYPANDILREYACWTPAFIIGFKAAETGFFVKADEYLTVNIPKRSARLILFAALAFLIPFENFLKHLYIPEHPVMSIYVIPVLDKILSILLVPFGMFCLIYVCRALAPHLPGKILAAVGRESLIMWLIHSAFFNYEAPLFQPVLFAPHFAVLITIWGLVLIYFPSLGLRKIIDFLLNNKKNKISDTN